MAESAGSMASGVQVSASATGPTRSPSRSRADVLQVFPIGDFDVTVSASAPVERFVPQPERP